MPRSAEPVVSNSEFYSPRMLNIMHFMLSSKLRAQVSRLGGDGYQCLCWDLTKSLRSSGLAPSPSHYPLHVPLFQLKSFKVKRPKKSGLCALKWNELIMSNGHNFLQLGVKVLDNLELTEINIYLSSRCLGRAESRSSPLGHPGTRQCL